MKSDKSMWRILLLDTKISNPNHYICLAIENALAADSRVESVHRVVLGQAIHVAKEQRCNLFFAFDGEELNVDICARLRKICGHAILWVTEDPYELPINLKHADLFDRVFTNDSASVAAYSGRAVHLPFAASPWLHAQTVREADDCRYDLLFVGTAWPNRVALLRSLMGGISNLRVKFALPSNPHLPPFDLQLPISAINWRTPNSEFIRLANASKVVLTLHRDFTTSIDTPSAAATPGPRLFEVALAGTCQLVDGSLQEVSQYFEDSQEIEIFNGSLQALERLRYLLAHPEKRTAIARAAQIRAMREHTYAQRVAVILDGLPKPLPSTVIASPARARILLLAHNVIGNGNWGGVEVYMDWIRRELSEQFDVWTYSPKQGTAGQCVVLRDNRGEIVETFDFGESLPEASLICPLREAAFSKVLLNYEIRALHVHHLMGHPPSLPMVAKALGVASILSLHDYYSVCEHFTLVGASGRYCGIETLHESDCDMCLGSTLNARPGSVARRRAWWNRVLGVFNVLHANTEGVRSRIETVYPTLRSHAGWSVIGVPVERVSSTIPSNNDDILRVAVPGNFTHFKGGRTLMAIFRQLSSESIEFTLLGRIDDEFLDYLNSEGFEHVRCVGSYKPGELHHELAGHHMSLHTSMWPETWCLTLSEAWRAKLVPIVTDVGALGERVKDGYNGYVVPLDRPSAIVDLLRKLSRDRDVLSSLVANVHENDILYEDAHKEWLVEQYHSLINLTVIAKTELPSQGLTVEQAGYILEIPQWLHRFSVPIKQSATQPQDQSATQPQEQTFTLSDLVRRVISLPFRVVRFFFKNGIFKTISRITFSIKKGLRILKEKP